MVCFPNAKINIGLNIIEKRPDGFHNIESVMYPLQGIMYDARSLARFLSKDMLPEARRKSKRHQKVGSLAQTRDKFVKSRTYFMNKVHGILNACGVKLKKEKLGTEKGLKEVMGYGIDEISRFEVEILVEQIRKLNEAIKKLDTKLVHLLVLIIRQRRVLSVLNHALCLMSLMCRLFKPMLPLIRVIQVGHYLTPMVK